MRYFLLLVCWFTLVLEGCGSEPEKKPEPMEPPPTFIHAKISVTNEVNPDVSGRPSPIVVRLIELKNIGKFEVADFDNLFQNYETFFGSDLLGSEQFHLRPGDTKIVKHAVAPETKYIAVTASYRDLNQAVWRDSIPIKPAKTSRLLILVDKLNISIKKY
jgi:type VI secretion system protein VasD